jgi:hypothetical protein
MKNLLLVFLGLDIYMMHSFNEGSMNIIQYIHSMKHKDHEKKEKIHNLYSKRTVSRDFFYRWALGSRMDRA